MAHRTQITLADEQYERLRAESRRSGLGLAELVRRAVDRMYGSTRPEETVHALDASFGSWTDRTDDGASYVEGLRHGMARRLAG
ncbi:ribbon-helix-helix protein, CopG family [Protofrankia symbiont of Coriaria ruscifolia]|uniref:ribbon-helix-helix protein, CopG family n=1 Tax=Protofrankia symbiont of Coriaria ruscifolia TaxID=1306542 RepID=UPI00104169E4|nr:ribbon-helix-helix protein, CopG family [Protofrankia symbiont of Coriaria ruscifolia]